MESTVFKKMRLKPGTSGIYLYAPEDYVSMTEKQDFIDFSKRENYEFVHLFITSKKDYDERIHDALLKLSDKGTLWISYPKSDRKNRYDINRDILFGITQEQGIIACSNVALDDRWSALRFKKM